MRIALLLLLVVIAGGVWLLDATDMTVDKTYASLADARAEGGGIAHGWLPDLLPASSYNIRTVNDLDHNRSHGHFRFMPSDASQVLSNFRNGAPNASDASDYKDWQRTLTEQRLSGRTIFSHQEERQTWTFFCEMEQGECEYVMW